MKNWRPVLSAFIVAAVAYVAWRQRVLLGMAADSLADAQLAWVIGAVITALLSLIAMAGVMQLLLSSEDAPDNRGATVSLGATSALTFASNAWSTTVPGGPALSAALTFQVQRRWGISAALCGWFFLVSSLLSTFWFLVLGVASMVFFGVEISVESLTLTGVLFVAACLLCWWVLHSPDTLTRWIPSDTLTTHLNQLRSVRTSPTTIVFSALLSLFNRLLDGAVLWCAVEAVSPSSVSVSAVTFGYLTAKLAGSVQVTPAGLGTVEAAIIGGLVAGGMDGTEATAATVLYRLVSFLLITAIGWVVYWVRYADKGFSGPALRDAVARDRQE